MISEKEQAFLALEKEIALLQEAYALHEWDSQTGMPKAATTYRSEAASYLSGKAFELRYGNEMKGFLDSFREQPEFFSEFAQLVAMKEREAYDINCNVPKDQFQAYMKVVSEADEAWRKGREAKDFGIFLPSLEKIVAYLKEFIPYWRKDEATSYDVLLDQYEPGMTTAILDPVFAQLRDGIMKLREELAAKGNVPETDFLARFVPITQQRAFASEVIQKIGYDFQRGRLDDTIHPFMLNINRNDARITTRWDEHDFTMAVFGIMHEAGHGMYEQNIAEKFDYTALAGGVSMGIHESQSLFNEIIIGTNQAFWQKQFPLFQAITEGTFADIPFEDFYKGLNKTESSLIRIEADSLTYPLHIMIRYEIEKMLFNGDVQVKDLPALWNDKYEEYLGIRPANDLEGILQDVHWSGGSFGYFPSYALGFMYAAQLLHSMKKDIPVDEILASDDYRPIKEWLTEKIHQHGASRKPYQLMMDATGEALNPQYLLDYMGDLYRYVYSVN